MDSDELARRIGLAWEKLPEPRHAFSLEIITPGRPSVYVNLGPHPPRLWPEGLPFAASSAILPASAKTMCSTTSTPSSASKLCALALLGVNLAIAGKLFGIEYSAYQQSIEGTFIALARLMIKYPGQWQWWPFWNGGLPFENTYLPLMQWLVAGFSVLSGLSPARSFHVVTASVYTLSALALFR